MKTGSIPLPWQFNTSLSQPGKPKHTGFKCYAQDQTKISHIHSLTWISCVYQVIQQTWKIICHYRDYTHWPPAYKLDPIHLGMHFGTLATHSDMLLGRFLPWKEKHLSISKIILHIFKWSYLQYIVFFGYHHCLATDLGWKQKEYI